MLRKASHKHISLIKYLSMHCDTCTYIYENKNLLLYYYDSGMMIKYEELSKQIIMLIERVK